MEQKTTYRFSEGLRKSKRATYAFMAGLPFFLVAAILLTPTTRPLDDIIVPMFLLLIFQELLTFSASRLGFARMKKRSISLFADRLERKSEKITESLFFKDIQTCELIQQPDGKVIAIKLKSNTNKIMLLRGLSDIEAVATQIESQLPNSAVVLRKEEKFDWESPLGIVIFSLAIGVFFILVSNVFGEKGRSALIVSMLSGTGGYLLLLRPYSRSISQEYREFEIVFGVIMFAVGLILAYNFFLLIS
ncbi:MAG: hypothetical protein HY869_24265 [Chloroflexi bacterium]|nr:hypothetical protein [Chloroflexota bacterium]